MAVLTKITSNILPKFTSRRERMTYWMMILGFIMYIVGAYLKIDTYATLAMYGGIATVAGYYLKKESDVPSKEPM